MFVVDVSANGEDLGGCLVPQLTDRCDLCPANVDEPKFYSYRRFIVRMSV
jgi:hypothetical protein